MSTSHNFSRRTLAKGAAWAVPTVAVASAAPALAASDDPIPPKALQGWILWSAHCQQNGTTRLTADGDSNNQSYPNNEYGFYVFNSTTTPVSACVTWDYGANYGSGIEWTPQGGSNGWSTPEYVGGRWQSCYSGTWTCVPDDGTTPHKYCVADGIPHFVGTASTCASSAVPVNITRCVTVDGQQICFNRHITLNGSNNLAPHSQRASAEVQAQSYAG